MVMMETKRVLEQALALTKTMLEHAKSVSWQEVIELEKQRAEELVKILPLTESDATLQPILQELITTNVELEQLCQQEKQAIAMELKKLAKSKQAVNSYTAI